MKLLELGSLGYIINKQLRERERERERERDKLHDTIKNINSQILS